MIIVEGACVERGQCVLVRDAAVQIGESSTGTKSLDASTLTETSNYRNDKADGDDSSNSKLSSTVAASASAQNGSSSDQEQSHSTSRVLKFNMQSLSSGAGSKSSKADRLGSLDDLERKLKIDVLSTANATINHENGETGGAGGARGTSGVNGGLNIRIESKNNTPAELRQQNDDVWATSSTHR